MTKIHSSKLAQNTPRTQKNCRSIWYLSCYSLLDSPPLLIFSTLLHSGFSRSPLTSPFLSFVTTDNNEDPVLAVASCLIGTRRPGEWILSSVVQRPCSLWIGKCDGRPWFCRIRVPRTGSRGNKGSLREADPEAFLSAGGLLVRAKDACETPTPLVGTRGSGVYLRISSDDVFIIPYASSSSIRGSHAPDGATAQAYRRCGFILIWCVRGVRCQPMCAYGWISISPTPKSSSRTTDRWPRANIGRRR